MKQKEHLPIFGIGPVYVGTIAIIAIIGIILSKKGYLDSGLIPELKIPMLIIGIVVALLGVFIWGYAFLRGGEDTVAGPRLSESRLRGVTTGP